MTIRSLRFILASVVPLIAGPSAFCHDFAEISQGIPPPPPTVEPGPDAAFLRVHIIDAASGETATATACVNGGDQEPDNDPAGVKYEKYRQANGLGDKTVARRGLYHISSGQEYRTFRRGQLGHVTIPIPSIVGRMEELKQELRDLIKSNESGLPLP